MLLKAPLIIGMGSSNTCRIGSCSLSDMLTLLIGLLVLLAVPIDAADVELSSNVDNGRQFICPGELVTFTCRVFMSTSLQWRSPHFSAITYTAQSTPPDTIIRSTTFEANLRSVSSGNITSTLRMLQPRNEVSVQCLTTQNNESSTFILTAVPGPPKELSVEYDLSTESLTIIWQPPENLGNFDLANYTVNVTSNSGTATSARVQARTLNLPVVVERNRRATFNVTVTATNMCGQTGSAALGSEEYVPSCLVMKLWDLPATGTTSVSNGSSLNDTAPSCVARSVGSVVLMNTTLNTATVAYYTGTTPGSIARFVCDEGSGYALNSTTNERVCQSDATWSGSSITCVCGQPRLLPWNIALIVSGVVDLGLGMLASVIIFTVRIRGVQWEPVLTIVAGLVAIASIFELTGIVLWITMGVVVANPPNGNMCDPSWRLSRDGLIIAGFVSSILVLTLTIFLPFIIAAVWEVCRKKMEENQEPKHEFRE